MITRTVKVLLIIAFSFHLVACKPLVELMEGLKNKVMGITTQNIIVSPIPSTLFNQPIIYRPSTPLKVLGKDYDLCFALKDNYENHSSEQNEIDFKKALNGGRINVVLTDQNGKTYNYPATAQRWSLYGEITGTGELSACMSCGCKESIPVGTTINQIQVTADKPIAILGIYWQSSNEEEKFEEKLNQNRKPQ